MCKPFKTNREMLFKKVCLKKVIQNQDIPITLKNSLQYKNRIQSKSESSFKRRPPFKNTEETDESIYDSNSKIDEDLKSLSLAEPAFRVPNTAQENSDICVSIEKYEDTTGKSLSFEKGQKFQVRKIKNSALKT